MLFWSLLLFFFFFFYSPISSFQNGIFLYVIGCWKYLTFIFDINRGSQLKSLPSVSDFVLTLFSTTGTIKTWWLLEMPKCTFHKEMNISLLGTRSRMLWIDLKYLKFSCLDGDRIIGVLYSSNKSSDKFMSECHLRK